MIGSWFFVEVAVVVVAVFKVDICYAFSTFISLSLPTTSNSSEKDFQ